MLYYLYNEDCAQSNSFMTLVSHEKLSDCQNLMCNEGKVSNWGEGKKGEGLGRVSSLPFSLSRSPPSSPLLLSFPPPPPFAPVTRYIKGQYKFLLLQCRTSTLLGVVLLVTAQVKQDNKVSGLSTSCSATFWQLLVFRATFCILSNFSSYLLILRYRNSFQYLN